MKFRVTITLTLLVIALAFAYSTAGKSDVPEIHEQRQRWEYAQLVYWFDTQRISIYAATSTLFDVAPAVGESGANLLTGDNGLMEYMNLLGENGWELVSTSEHYSELPNPDVISLFFKRAIPD
jgi:hypothetical protein